MWRFLKKLEIELPYDPATPCLFQFLSVYAQQWDCWIIWQFYFQFLKESPHCSPYQDCWEKYQLCKLQKTVWRFLKKLEIELPYDPAIPLLGIHNQETRIKRDTCTPVFIAALFHNSQDTDATQMSINRRMDKKAVVN